MDFDTVVIPAKDDGFHDVFLRENRWYALKIKLSMIPKIKHIAVYRTAPVSAITHVAPVRSIQPWKNTGKVVVDFAEPAQEIGPISLVKRGRVKPIQNVRYTTYERLSTARTLDEVF